MSGNETNGQAPVSGNETNGQAPVSENENVTPEQPQAPHLRVIKGNPTDDEVAALITVLAGASGGGGGAQGEPEFSRWGLHVDKLRYAIHSWQRMSLQQRAHLRGR